MADWSYELLDHRWNNFKRWAEAVEKRKDKPKSGQSDHTCDATRYAVMGLNTLFHFPLEEIQETMIQRIKRKKGLKRISSRRELGVMI